MIYVPKELCKKTIYGTILINNYAFMLCYKPEAIVQDTNMQVYLSLVPSAFISNFLDFAYGKEVIFAICAGGMETEDSGILQFLVSTSVFEDVSTEQIKAEIYQLYIEK